MPHASSELPPKRRMTLGEMQEHARTLPKIDVRPWYADRAADDLIFDDDHLEY